MATWLGGVPDDIERIELVSVRLGGWPSAVVSAVFVVHRAAGGPLRLERLVEPPLMYETLVERVRATNASLAARRRG